MIKRSNRNYLCSPREYSFSFISVTFFFLLFGCRNFFVIRLRLFPSSLHHPNPSYIMKILFFAFVRFKNRKKSWNIYNNNFFPLLRSLHSASKNRWKEYGLYESPSMRRILEKVTQPKQLFERASSTLTAHRHRKEMYNWKKCIGKQVSKKKRPIPHSS